MSNLDRVMKWIALDFDVRSWTAIADRPAIVVLGVLMAIKWLVGLVYVR